MRYGGAESLARPFEASQPILLAISGLARAVGAALIFVRNVAEYARLERRSDAMAAALERSRQSLDRQDAEHRGYGWLGGHLESLGVQMTSVSADWRTLVIPRRLEFVG